MQVGGKEEHSQALCKDWCGRNLSCHMRLRVFFERMIVILMILKQHAFFSLIVEADLSGVSSLAVISYIICYLT
jgi:hypothetical protein